MKSSVAGDDLAIRDWLVLGHHGTTVERADAIKETGFEITENEYDWLGSGVYFFERSPLRAIEWARDKYPHCQPCVMAAEIAFGRDGQNCLDLASREGLTALEKFFREFVFHFPREYVAGLKETPSGYRQFSYHVINRFCIRMAEVGWDIHAIRSPFDEGDYIFSDPDGIFPTARLRKLTHIQIAVRDCGAIRDIWLDDQLATEV
jgi:hypothetical protein